MDYVKAMAAIAEKGLSEPNKVNIDEMNQERAHWSTRPLLAVVLLFPRLLKPNIILGL